MADRSRVPSHLLGLTALLGACNDSDPCADASFTQPPEPMLNELGPPALVSGTWISSGVLELQFSKPLSSDGDLDPMRFAITGWDAQASDGYDVCYLRTSYRELSPGYFYYYGGSYSQRSVDSAWIGPEDDTLLRLRLGTTTNCRVSNGSLATGIIVTYTNGGDDSVGSKLLDGEGDPVPDFGPLWAIQQLDACLAGSNCSGVNYFSTGHLPLLSTLVDIPCP